jgi:hypothetical protein
MQFAAPSTANSASDRPQSYCREAAGHPPYRFILAHGDSISTPKKHLTGQRITTDIDMKQAVTWLKKHNASIQTL